MGTYTCYWPSLRVREVEWARLGRPAIRERVNRLAIVEPVLPRSNPIPPFLEWGALRSFSPLQIPSRSPRARASQAPPRLHCIGVQTCTWFLKSSVVALVSLSQSRSSGCARADSTTRSSSPASPGPRAAITPPPTARVAARHADGGMRRRCVERSCGRRGRDGRRGGGRGRRRRRRRGGLSR